MVRVAFDTFIRIIVSIVCVCKIKIKTTNRVVFCCLTQHTYNTIHDKFMPVITIKRYFQIYAKNEMIPIWKRHFSAEKCLKNLFEIEIFLHRICIWKWRFENLITHRDFFLQKNKRIKFVQIICFMSCVSLIIYNNLQYIYEANTGYTVDLLHIIWLLNLRIPSTKLVRKNFCV